MKFSAGSQDPEMRLVLMSDFSRSERNAAMIWGVIWKCPEGEESSLLLLLEMLFVSVLLHCSCTSDDRFEFWDLRGASDGFPLAFAQFRSRFGTVSRRRTSSL